MLIWGEAKQRKLLPRVPAGTTLFYCPRQAGGERTVGLR